MSFSADVKNEIAQLPLIDACCMKCEWLAVQRCAVRMDHENEFLFHTESASVARRVFKLIKSLTVKAAEVSYVKSMKFKRHTLYTVKVPKGIENEDYENVCNQRIDTQRTCCAKAYLRGAFMAVGSVADPEKTYHMELVIRNEDGLDVLMKCFSEFDMQPPWIVRKNDHVIYIKEAEQIVDFLNIIGAHKALLAYEDVRVFKSVRNDINRLVNCETANLGKTVNASVRQMEAIRSIMTNVGLNTLPPGLAALARARLANPEASLKELGEMIKPPLGKSGVQHRMQRILQIAKMNDPKESNSHV